MILNMFGELFEHRSYEQIKFGDPEVQKPLVFVGFCRNLNEFIRFLYDFI